MTTQNQARAAATDSELQQRWSERSFETAFTHAAAGMALAAVDGR